MSNRSTPIKKRSSNCYQRKVNKITKWYNHLMAERDKNTSNENIKQIPHRKDLKDLSYYIEKIKKPFGDRNE